MDRCPTWYLFLNFVVNLPPSAKCLGLFHPKYSCLSYIYYFMVWYRPHVYWPVIKNSQWMKLSLKSAVRLHCYFHCIADGCAKTFQISSQWWRTFCSMATTQRGLLLLFLLLAMSSLNFPFSCSYDSMKALVDKYNEIIDSILRSVSYSLCPKADIDSLRTPHKKVPVYCFDRLKALRSSIAPLELPFYSVLTWNAFSSYFFRRGDEKWWPRIWTGGRRVVFYGTSFNRCTTKPWPILTNSTSMNLSHQRSVLSLCPSIHSSSKI